MFSPSHRIMLTIAGWIVAGTLAVAAEKEGKYVLSEVKHPGGIWAVADAPDGKLLATGGEDRTIRLWDIAKGTEVRKIATNGAVALTWSPDGKMLTSAPGGGAPSFDPQLFDPATGKELRHCTGHANVCYFVAFSPNGKLLASASMDQTVRLWDTATGKEVRVLRGHTATVLRVVFSPDGKMVISVGDDGTIRLWETGTGKQLTAMTGHPGQILAVNVSPDSRMIATGGGDGTVRIWDVRTAKELRRFTLTAAQQISSVCFSRDGRNVAAGLAKGTTALIEVGSGRQRWAFTGHTNYVYSVSFSRDGKTMISGGHDGRAARWDWTAPGRDNQPMSGIWSDEALTGLWQRLRGEDATAAYEAVGSLSGSGGSGVRWIKDHLKAAPVAQNTKADEERVAHWLVDLDDEEFEVREKASAALRALDRRAESAMRKELAKTTSAEVKRRLEKLLERFDNNSLSSEELLAVRGVEVLERIGSTEAKDVLRALAKGDETARSTEEARTALERLGGR